MRALVLLACAACAVVLGAAACGSWYDKDESSPTAASVLGALTLTAAPTSVQANGFSTVLVTAKVSAEATLAHRVVVFNTTRGTFVGSGSPETTTLERTVDSENTARAELRSSRTVESARVTATVKDVAGLISNEVVVAFTAASPTDALRLTAATSSAPADGATITPMTAEVSGSLPAGRRTVTFTTTLGRFVGDPSDTEDEGSTNISADADGGNRAVAYLRSPGASVGTAFITAKVDAQPTVSASASVQFVRAAPQRVLVTTDQPTLPPNFTQTIKITATLARDPGIPTEQTIVTFGAVDSAGNTRGVFTNVIRSNAKGVATADFAAGTLAALGPMTITATAENVSGSTVVQVQ